MKKIEAATLVAADLVLGCVFCRKRRRIKRSRRRREEVKERKEYHTCVLLKKKTEVADLGFISKKRRGKPVQMWAVYVLSGLLQEGEK